MEEVKILTDYVKANCAEFECYRNLACIYLMAVQGFRCVEVHRANQEDIDWNSMTMVVHGKGHDGIAYFDDSVARILQDYLDCLDRYNEIQGTMILPDKKGTPLIVSNSSNKYGTRLARESIRWNMNKILQGAGLKRMGAACHVMRHSCATALYENTKDLRIVQETLRHRDPKVTTRYAHVVEQLRSKPTAALGRMLE